VNQAVLCVCLCLSRCRWDVCVTFIYGVQASPLQCAAIADSCLAMGAATCRAAVTAINKAVEQQQLGPKAAGAKVRAHRQNRTDVEENMKSHQARQSSWTSLPEAACVVGWEAAL
jgi:hypothetical protein